MPAVAGALPVPRASCRSCARDGGAAWAITARLKYRLASGKVSFHYELVRPDRVHVFRNGAIVRSGDAALAVELDQRGYDWVTPAAAGS